MLQASEFDYNLPPELIAQTPFTPRDHSRLLLLERVNGETKHGHFYDLPDFLEKGDVLVMNNSKVFPARMIGQKKTGGKMEVFLLRFFQGQRWQILIGGRGAKQGLEISFSENLNAVVVKNNEDGTWEAEFNLPYVEMMKIVEKIGHVPLPPYIHRNSESAYPAGKSGAMNHEDKDRYQTVYADDTKKGSVAAPTAGLHFTPELLEKIKEKGVEILYITLHVGLGTFAPVKVEDITQHKMHAEYVEIEADVIGKIIKAKKEKKRVIAVGTTSARSLEACFIDSTAYRLPPKAYSSWVNIFIYPGYEFKIVDGLITNFHLPKSTLLMLVSALAGKEKIKCSYREAIEKKYRFFSYGDAMLII